MLADFGIGLLIGGGACIGLIVLVICLGIMGWMDSGSH